MPGERNSFYGTFMGDGRNNQAKATNLVIQDAMNITEEQTCYVKIRGSENVLFHF